jgi:DNA-binding LacI/PurR family transcriptional regulator
MASLETWHASCDKTFCQVKQKMRKSAAKLGIREVAAAARVSITTVSLALNGKGRVAEQTRARVIEVAERLGYQPHPSARSLKGGRTGVVALAFSYRKAVPFPLTDFDYFNHAIQAATEAALARDCGLVIGPPTAQSDVWSRLPLDGVVVFDPVLGDPVPGQLRKRGTPMVVVGRDPNGDFDDPNVDNDHVAGTRLALDHLWERGARKIALFAYPLWDAFVTVSETVYRAWCAERGIEPKVLVFPPMWDRAPRQVAAELFASCDRPDAIFSLEDDLGLESLSAAFDNGLRVPEDLKIVACTDREVFPDLPLTTIELDPGRTAREAIDLLLDIVEGRNDVPSNIEIPVRLVPREST